MCQSCIPAVVVQPQLAVNHKGSHNDACGIGADRTVKPVCTVHHVETLAIRHHVTATVRQADEVPEPELAKAWIFANLLAAFLIDDIIQPSLDFPPRSAGSEKKN